MGHSSCSAVPLESIRSRTLLGAAAASQAELQGWLVGRRTTIGNSRVVRCW
jgi:hypothetical protein